MADETTGCILSPIIVGSTVQEHWSWHCLGSLALLHEGNRLILPRIAGPAKALLNPIYASRKTLHASEGSRKEGERGQTVMIRKMPIAYKYLVA